MQLTLGGIAGAVIVANLLTVWLVWGVREFVRARREGRGPGLWPYVAIIIPGMFAVGAIQVAVLAAA